MQTGNELIVAYCGLVCTDCGAYKRQKCKGCFGDKPMFHNCPVKRCAGERRYTTCADCVEFDDLKKCGKLNNFISKIFGFVFRKNRIGNLDRIREVGLERFREKESKESL
jgi:hypothetical protein